MSPSASTKHWDFEKVLDGEVAIFRAGSGEFTLQRYFQEDWAGNVAIQLNG